MFFAERSAKAITSTCEASPPSPSDILHEYHNHKNTIYKHFAIFNAQICFYASSLSKSVFTACLIISIKTLSKNICHFRRTNYVFRRYFVQRF